MPKILIWRSIEKGNELDIFHSTDYSTFHKDISDRFGGMCPNWGNKLWFQGLVSEIDDGINEISFRKNESPDEINANFDLIIYPMANFFGTEHVHAMEPLAESFAKIKIPVYIIACGVQAKSYEEMDRLVSAIGEPSKKFISAIYNTGGEIALRGHFSKIFFDRLGFPSAVVTGCPSLYQLGRNFKVEATKVSRDELFPVFNGNSLLYRSALDSYKNSPYIDQDQYFSCLFDKEYLSDLSLRTQRRFMHFYGVHSAKLLAERRVKLIADMNDWYSYLKTGGFNYSFGTRIHGSIMAILSGIPATLVAIDSRTKEMAEFFDIPLIDAKKGQTFDAKDVYEAYLSADYTKFNQSFAQKYDLYEKFLSDKGIVTKINENNSFFDPTKSSLSFEHFIENADKFSLLHKKISRSLPLLKASSLLMSIKNRIVG